MIRIFGAYKDFPAAILSKQEAEHFLTSDKRIVHVGTIDNSGEPDVRPTWYFFDASNHKLYVEIKSDSKTVRNLARNKTVYFCIDDPSRPYKGVRGKGKVSIHEDDNFNLPIFENIGSKYTDGEEKKNYLEFVKYHCSVVLEIAPRFYVTWDDSKINSNPNPVVK